MPEAAKTLFRLPTTIRQKDYRAYLYSLNRTAPPTVYWVTAGLSLIWLFGGLLLGHLLFTPSLWDIGSVGDLFNRPASLGMVVTIVIPILFFWGFAAMIRRAEDMRVAARSMAEVAFRLTELRAWHMNVSSQSARLFAGGRGHG